MLNTGILVLERESEYRKAYDAGVKKDDYWKSTLEEALNIIAWIPEIAAYIYRRKFRNGVRIAPDPKLDWAGNYAHMLGIPDPTGEFKNLMRLYMVLHSDHEGGNVSAHPCHCVGSALSDAFYAVSAGLDGLAGEVEGDARGVVLLREVAEQDVLEARAGDAAEQLPHLVVGQMPLAGADAAFEEPGVGPLAQHVDAVVGLQQDELAVEQGMHDAR